MLGAALAATVEFWVLPAIEHTASGSGVPDVNVSYSITGNSGANWTTDGTCRGNGTAGSVLTCQFTVTAANDSSEHTYLVGLLTVIGATLDSWSPGVSEMVPGGGSMTFVAEVTLPTDARFPLSLEFVVIATYVS